MSARLNRILVPYARENVPNHFLPPTSHPPCKFHIPPRACYLIYFLSLFWMVGREWREDGVLGDGPGQNGEKYVSTILHFDCGAICVSLRRPPEKSTEEGDKAREMRERVPGHGKGFASKNGVRVLVFQERQILMVSVLAPRQFVGVHSFLNHAQPHSTPRLQVMCFYFIFTVFTTVGFGTGPLQFICICLLLAYLSLNRISIKVFFVFYSIR